MEEERILTGEPLDGERGLDLHLRPRRMEEFLGQEKVKQNLQVFIRAAQRRREPLDHTLLYGPPGLGKTTLAQIIAREFHGNLRATSGPAIEKAGDLAALLTNLEPRSFLFIDEIHRLHPALEEILYQAMEDYKLDLMIGQGVKARSVKLDLAPFTLLGSSTRIGLLSSPFRDRFGIVEHIGFYDLGELARILQRTSRILSIGIDPEGAREIARRSRGTPRVANRLLRRIRDFAQVEGRTSITLAVAESCLGRLEVDRWGLDEIDRRILRTIGGKFGGGPVGINSIAAAIGEDRGTLEEIYEPYLIQIGFLDRTPRGRCVTDRARSHLKIPSPRRPPAPSDQRQLW